MERAAKTWLVCAIIVGGLLAALCYHAFVRWGLGIGYPSSTFLFRPELRFSDFYDIFGPVQSGSPLGSQSAVYFPFAYVPLFPLTIMSSNKALAITLVVFSASVFWFFWRRVSFLPLKRKVIAVPILAFLTYPFLICVDRANLEMFVLLFVFAFFACLERNRHMVAGILLACATAMKFYPGALGILLLQRRKYKAAVLTAATTFAVSLAAAAAYPGGISGTVALMSQNLEYFRDAYIFSGERAYFSSSYFAVMKVIARLLDLDVRALAQAVRPLYILASLAIFGIVLFYLLKYERTLWKSAALIVFLMILLPEVSYDYKLIHLFLPLGLFLSAEPEEAGNDRLYAVLFGLLLIPKAYAPIGSETTLGVVANPLLMTFMLAHIIWTGVTRREPAAMGEASRRDGDQRASAGALANETTQRPEQHPIAYRSQLKGE